MIALRDVEKGYVVGGQRHPVLRDISLTVEAGEFVAIVGPSGSGKSTLLNLITAIDRTDQGEIRVAGHALHTMNEEQLAVWRGTCVGIVFQFFQLLPGLSLLHNVMLPMDLVGRYSPGERHARALDLLDQVGVVEQAYKLPGAVSGGQQQRAAIARSLANDPPLIVADEPTGNVDTETAERLFALFESLVHGGKTMLMVTHNDELAARAQRTIEIRDGVLVRDTASSVLTGGSDHARHLA